MSVAMGDRIIAAIVRGSMLRVMPPNIPGGPCVIVWAANANEQLGELVLEMAPEAIAVRAQQALDEGLPGEVR